MTLPAFSALRCRSAKACSVAKGLAAVARAYATAFSKFFYFDHKMGKSIHLKKLLPLLFGYTHQN
jgi:hypothetical protein